MDVRVLEVQRWVNATYGSVAGYEKCPEDGRVGWPTLYSLTRALQYELGITPLSDNLGPSTLSKLAERGGIKLAESNQNIVKIVQCGCFCKGYDAGATDGTFGRATRRAVSSLMSNAGVGELGNAVPPKVVKALLTMDAYELVRGGSRNVRTVQQWLNGAYLARQNFFVIPCDGKVSRQAVLALRMAIQFELGMTDDQATGVFGSGTRGGLQNHVIGEGHSGIWVRLFSAGLVINEYGSFTEVFDRRLVEATRDFQEFSALQITGRGDYQTWCQLMASNGDPDRLGAACDCAMTITDARAKALYAAGYRIIGRYLDNVPGSTLDKKIKPGELQTIFATGLKVFPISQYFGGERDYFTCERGVQDATKAHEAAAGYGFPPGTVIYFAVDYDAIQDDLDSNIIPYFEGVVDGLASAGRRYRHGVYGARNVCSQVSERTGARWSFVAGMSTGYSGNLGFPLPDNWAFNQIQTLTVGGGDGQIEVDKNAHRPGTDAAVLSVETVAEAGTR